MTGVAVVGIACRFPGGEGKEAFWRLLRTGGDGVGPVPDTRWEPDHYYSADGGPGTINNREGGFLRDVDTLDNRFFAISDADAAALDPHQRLLLGCAYHAIEDAGADPRALASAGCGVYLGMTGNEWVWRTRDDTGGFDVHQGAGTGHHMAANRLSYQLNLRGPSLTVDTACSSSLVAVHLAARAVATGECEWALAGGVSVVLEPVNGIYFTLLGLSARDGHCKPFSSAADGMVRGEGVGVVVLRRLADARADRQRIYAVIRGGAVSHNGRSNGITAPARWGQQDAITRAYQRAAVAPADIAFVEAHGSGTLIGDAIEINALKAVHGADRSTPCLVGSVKGNIGHAEGAAGIASFIKAALAVHHRLLPPTTHSAPVNPVLGLDGPVLRLADRPVELPADRLAGGVSAFGLSGTNAHVVITGDDRPARPPTSGPGVFTVSAPSDAALRRNLLAQADALAEPTGRRPGDDEDLAALCHTSNRAKAALRHRYAVVARSRSGLAYALRRGALQPEEFPRAGQVRVALLLAGPLPPVPHELLAARSAAFRRAWQAAELPPAAPADPADPADPAGPALAGLVAVLAALGIGPALVAPVGDRRDAAGLAGAAARLAAVTGAPLAETPGAATHLLTVGATGAAPAAPGPARLPLAAPDDPDLWYAVARIAALLHRAGADVRWDELYAPDQRQVRELPPYRFAPSRFPLPQPRRPRAHAGTAPTSPTRPTEG
ncbi:beta-ketoacyl synthase N-terminal-like domain-containing protein [Plantactinospora siamensis]|uniref:Beta-ketoacyl synthase N-terminal-like domain-containing protein n=1 Tax=Plantactinospora siamensis TaxID=555372 RepID=A0ABV6NWN0_9ACTN